MIRFPTPNTLTPEDKKRIKRNAVIFMRTFDEGFIKNYPWKAIIETYVDAATAEHKQKRERFKKPTDDQVVDFALVFNEGMLDKQKLTDMVAMCMMIIDRLYDNGDIMVKSKKQIENEEQDDRARNKVDLKSDLFDHGAY